MIDVLVDMTALNTPTSQRGTGRYVRSLCATLAGRETWLAKYPDLPGSGLRISGLVRHFGKIEGALDPSLLFAGRDDADMSDLRVLRHRAERHLFMSSLLKRLGSRLLHVPDPPGMPFERRQRRIVTCHDLIPLVLSKDYLSPLPGVLALRRARDRSRYGNAARVIAISEATRRDLVRELDLSPERIDVVHHGVDHERFTAQAEPNERASVERRLGLAGSYLLYMGAGDPRKNLHLLVRAYARSGVQHDVRLVLAGPISPRQRARLRHEAAQNGVEQRVQLLGYVDDALLAPLYRQCLAHVFPSSYEGFGLTVLEAMACAAPTLTTSLSSLGEVAGDAALTLAELSEEPFAAALQRLVSDAALRADLSRRGLEHARRFTWERCAAQTLGCYQRALEQ